MQGEACTVVKDNGEGSIDCETTARIVLGDVSDIEKQTTFRTERGRDERWERWARGETRGNDQTSAELIDGRIRGKPR